MDVVLRAAGTYLGLGVAFLVLQLTMVRTSEPPCDGVVSHSLWNQGQLSTIVRWLPDVVRVIRGDLTLRDFAFAGYTCETLADTLDLEKLGAQGSGLTGGPGPGGGASSGGLVGSIARGPTAITIAAGLVTAEDSRAGLVGTWEPDADLGLPPGSNHITYLPDGVYVNPFRNVALVGFWDATADSLTMTPIDIRDLETAAPVPDLKNTFSQIAWNTPGANRIAWLTPDRYQEEKQREPRRRTSRVHDVTGVHIAILGSVLPGSWVNEDGGEVVFTSDGRFGETFPPSAATAREIPTGRSMVAGVYSLDPETGAVQREVLKVDDAGGTGADLRMGPREPAAVRWLNSNEFELNGKRWRRTN
jgi:hypothetical protein